MIAAHQSPPSPRPRWSEGLGNPAAAVLIVAAFVWRLLSAHSRFLNADEAMHYLLARQPSFMDAYRASLGTAHPPLLIILLYYWTRISSTEFFLRFPSVIAGTASGWFLYRWLRLVRDRGTALIAMALLLFSPALIYTSAEVRQYALALGFMSAALYLLERALMANSALLMLASAVSLYLALWTHYSALIFAASIAVYGLVRIASAHSNLPVIAVWSLSQAGAAGIATFLWKTHIGLIRHRSLIQDVAESYLRSSLFHPRQENVFVFLLGSNLRLFHFLFSQGAVS
ncbi:MAG TPA: glycosyltransferase family 39 protein, partial [Sphingomicrobium sp.]|nr:glycosyltransferase family 39 protein [Sphingomicrobium sp.]